MRLIEALGDVRARVVEVLCSKYLRARDDDRRREIIRALGRLVPAEELTRACLGSTSRPS